MCIYIYVYVIYTYMYKYTMRQNILPDGLPNKYTRKALETIGELVYPTRVDIYIYHSSWMGETKPSYRW